MRKNKSPPKIDRNNMLELSKTIQKLKIINKNYEDITNMKNCFIYLDPPYMNNTNGHYNKLSRLQIL